MGKRSNNISMNKEAENAVTETFTTDVEKAMEAESPAKVETTGYPETKTGTVVNTSYVYVRKSPDLESEHMEIMRKGDKVAIIGRSGKFYKVGTSVNPIGYISSEFLKEE